MLLIILLVMFVVVLSLLLPSLISQPTTTSGRALPRPALGCAIAVVVPLRAKPQVSRIDAGWIVAAVQDAQAIRDGADEILMGESMSKHVSAAHSCSRSGVNKTVPMPIPHAFPLNAALVRDRANPAKEAIFEGDNFCFAHTGLGTKTAAEEFQMIASTVINLAAKLASKLNGARLGIRHDRPLARLVVFRAGRQFTAAVPLAHFTALLERGKCF